MGSRGHFHDVREIWGAGEEQVRNIWSNIGCWNLNQWMYTLVKLCSWDVDKSELTDCGDRPWDNPDRRRVISPTMLEEQFLVSLPETLDTEKLRGLVETLISLCA